MPTTRSQQKILDKEIDFNRKDENNNQVTIIKRWGKPDRFLYVLKRIIDCMY